MVHGFCIIGVQRNNNNNKPKNTDMNAIILIILVILKTLAKCLAWTFLVGITGYMIYRIAKL